MQDEMLALFRDGLREAKKQRKSDDILDFIKANWKLSNIGSLAAQAALNKKVNCWNT